MAALKGDLGKVLFHKDDGTDALISGTKSWSFSMSKDTIETTVQNDDFKTFVGGAISGEGSATLIYDNAGNSNYLDFISDVFQVDDPADASFELFPDSGATKKINFKGIITGAEYGAAMGEVQEINISFISSGQVSQTL